MIYAFRCSDCGASYDHPHHPEFPSPCCGAPLRRDWRHVTVRRSMPAHWNHSVGAFVRNEADFGDALKRKGDEMSERTGTDHRYTTADLDNCGATDDGLEVTHRAARDSGRVEPKRRIFTP